MVMGYDIMSFMNLFAGNEESKEDQANEAETTKSIVVVILNYISIATTGVNSGRFLGHTAQKECR